jgi:hypothetical protein
MRAAENDEISLESKSQTDRETRHDWRLLGWRRDCLDISVLGIGHGGLAGDSNVTPVIGVWQRFPERGVKAPAIPRLTNRDGRSEPHWRDASGLRFVGFG